MRSDARRIRVRGAAEGEENRHLHRRTAQHREQLRAETGDVTETEEEMAAMTEEEKKKIGLERLPENLSEAVEELEKSEFICQILGEHIVKNFCKAKKAEWEEYTNQVTQWELDQYLYRI